MHKQEVKNQCGPKLGLFNNLVNLSNSSHGKRGEQIKKKKHVLMSEVKVRTSYRCQKHYKRHYVNKVAMNKFLKRQNY